MFSLYFWSNTLSTLCISYEMAHTFKFFLVSHLHLVNSLLFSGTAFPWKESVERASQLHMIWRAPGLKPHSQPSFLIINWRISSTQTSLVCSISAFRIRLTTLKEKSVREGNVAKSDLLAWLQQVLQRKSCHYLSSENKRNPAALRMLNTSPANTHHKRKVGWTAWFWNNGFEN